MIDNPVLLLLLLAAIVAVPLVLRRQRASAPHGIRVLGRTALHKNAIVAVIVVGGRRLLVGAGDRGVQLLADLDDAAAPLGHDISTTTMTMTAIGRTDAPDPASTEPDDAALAAFAPGPVDVPTAGPGIGLIDRLRAMTVRTPERGRPSHDPPDR